VLFRSISLKNEAAQSSSSTLDSLLAQDSRPKTANNNPESLIIRTSFNEIALYDMVSGENLKSVSDYRENGDPNHVQCIQIIDDNNVISFSDDPIIKQFDLTTGNVVKKFVGHVKTVCDVSKSEMGLCWGEIISENRLVSCGWDRTIRVWSLESTDCLRLLKGHSAAVNRVKELPNQQLISGSEDKSLKLWSIFSGKCSRTFVGHTAGVRCIAVLTNNRIVSGSDDSNLKVWDLGKAECLATLKGHTNRITCVEVLPNKQKICSASEDSSLRLWDLVSFTCIRKINAHSMVAWTLKIVSNEKAISGGVDLNGFEQKIKVWDLNTGKCLQVINEANNLIQTF